MKPVKVLLFFLLFFAPGCQEELPDTPPIIISFTPREGLVGTQIVLSGSNFGDSPKVFINDTPMLVDDFAGDILKAIVPPSATSGPIRVENGSLSATTNEQFTVVELPGNPIIAVRAYRDTGEPISVLSPGQTVFFQLDPRTPPGGKVSFDGRELLNVRDSYDGGNLAEIPQGVRTGRFSHTYNGVTKFFDKEIMVLEDKGSWTLQALNPPNQQSLNYNPLGFAIDDRLYIGVGMRSDPSRGAVEDFFPGLYAFNHQTAAWSQVSNYPGKRGAGARGSGLFAFSLNGFGYVGGGTADGKGTHQFYRLDPSAGTWTELDSLSDAVAQASYGFTAGDRAYVWNIADGPLFEYDRTNDNFLPRGNAPVQLAERDRVCHFALNGKAYFLIYLNATEVTTVWQYDPAGNSWAPLNDLPRSGTMFAVAIDNKAYIGIGSWFGEYDVVTGNLIQGPPPPVPLDGPAYSVGKSGYVHVVRPAEFPERAYSRLYRFTAP